MASHTPGPWVVHRTFRNLVIPESDAMKLIGGASDTDRESESYAKEIADTTRITCDRHPEFHRSRVWRREGEANARRIAAAPDLLAACKSVVAMAVAWEPLTTGDIADVIAAIAKAEPMTSQTRSEQDER